MFNPQCRACGLSDACNNVCTPAIGPYFSNLMIVGESPGLEEANGSVMTAKKDRLLRQVIESAMDMNLEADFYTTYLVKCSSTKPATKKEVATCFTTYLSEEIKMVKPQVILTMGELAFNTLTGEKGITKQRGKEFKTPDGITVIPTFAPGYASQTDNSTELFAKDVYKAYLLSIGDKEGSAVKVPYSYVLDAKTMHELCDSIIFVGKCTFDFETNAEPAYRGLKPTILSVSFQPGYSWVLPLEHEGNVVGIENTLPLMHIFNERVLQNKDVIKCGHNVKYELHVLASYFGIVGMRGRINDTMLMHHLIDEDKKHGLKIIIDELFPEYGGYEDNIKGYKWDNMPFVPLCEYGATDTERTLVLEVYLESLLLEDEQIYNLYRNLTAPSIRTTFAAENLGMLIDKDLLLDSIESVSLLAQQQDLKLRSYPQIKKFEAHNKIVLQEKEIAKLMKELGEAEQLGKAKVAENRRKKIEDIKNGTISIDYEINFGAPAQLANLLYGPSGFKFTTKFGSTTGKEILQQIPDTTGFIEDLQVFRSINKMLSTYLVAVDQSLDKNGCLHTSFLIHGTESGRWSSKDPNLQNIPKFSKLDDELTPKVVDKIKKNFIPRPGHVFVQVDYGQAELRIAAEFADERKMLSVYAEDGDLHIATAMNANSLSQEQWDALDKATQKKHRQNAKAGNFGLIYGMGVDGFIDYARNTYKVHFTKEEATRFRNGYFKTYAELLQWHSLYILEARKEGFVRTLFGRKRHTPLIKDTDDYIAAQDERIAINSPVQGTAGEFTIFAIVLLANRLDTRVRFVNTVHDSIIFEVPVELVVPSARIIKNTMENLPTLKYFNAELTQVKMKVDLEYSEKSWGDLQPLDLENFAL